MSRNQKIAAGVVGVAGLGFALWLLFRPRAATLPVEVLQFKQAVHPAAGAKMQPPYEGTVLRSTIGALR